MNHPILALDIGKQRTGVALNPTGTVVLELATLRHADGAAFRTAVEALLQQHHPTMVVVGRSRVTVYESELRALIPASLLTVVDETLTTKEAERQLEQESGHQSDSDARSARLILEQYLQSSKHEE